jgi:hypothetical protein
MTYSTEWQRLREAENNYFSCQHDFMQNEERMLSELKKALTQATQKETALRLLLQMQSRVALIVPLLPEILDIAIDSTGLTGIMLAKDVLQHYKGELQIKDNVKTIVNSYLMASDEWHYRRIAELYQLLAYKEEFVDFLLLCRVSSNLEIQEIADDFQSSSH